ncbi:MAG: Phenylalanine-tRNA ligase beta subunit [Candidatus Daviesbacteria bacterium GW2011_GWA2_38_24]|uniref:Phenylalanine--tRNA ligase beta subunit n=1 Tax=Candidatus Daviesbacteria bacterium GW2011_GWA2_38_24 TaxID=1618422 RepID=A0A0G0MK47_9BACT|nr:MAG: Phenylalanine-tRNA ligase beta subunit [Candidatus Daviesbacteria bacterium GW2011_GWA2_38_24]KKQ79145.1 MAG: Phenylalanine-tRNA ligase beta subunit [Candidatus Daviesbacteria bacterium GW2011_GWA1_38_7]
MRVSINWLRKLIELDITNTELVNLLPLRTIGTKEATEDFIELDMKGYNRADLLSMRGVAYEIAAITNSNVLFQEPNGDEYIWNNQTLPQVDVKVEDTKLVPLYCVAKIEGIEVSPTDPTSETAKLLTDSGMRPVNNIVDITNLVMLEYGQPLHAFDADSVENQTIVVRTAEEGEKITTLDDKERGLMKTDLIIADPQKPIGIAGVMGSKSSEVGSSTTTILLEAAIFDPVTLRRTVTRLNLPSEASKRFIHGLTKERLFQALDAAIRKLGGKLTALTIVDNLNQTPVSLNLKLSKVNALIGIEFTPEQVEEYLKRLNFSLEKMSENAWKVTAPYYRLDIQVEEDLIEEIARLYGYEKIPAKELQGVLPKPIDQSLFKLIEKVRAVLVELGLSEVQTYSFYSTAVLSNLEKDKSKLVKILNPISIETEYMRDNIWPNLLEAAIHNLKFFDDVAIFEIGKVYRQNQLPEERYILSTALSNSTDNPLLELNTIFTRLTTALDKAISVNSQITHNQEFHPIRNASLEKDQQNVGLIAEVHPRIVNRFKEENRTAVLEIDLKALL